MLTQKHYKNNKASRWQGGEQIAWETALGSTPYNYAGSQAPIMEALSSSACVHNAGSMDPHMNLWTEIREAVNLNGKKLAPFMFTSSYMRSSHLFSMNSDNKSQWH